MKKFPLKIVDDTLKRWFYRLGVYIGHNPGYFIIVPLLLTALAATGFQRMNYNYDPEYLLSPTTGMAKTERENMEKYFPVDYNYFQPQRMSRVGKFGRVIITAKDGGSILRTDIWDSLLYLEGLVYNVTVEHEGSLLNYRDICAKWDGYCKVNEIMNLAGLMPEIESLAFNLSYPLTFDPITFEQYNLAAYLGGVEMGEYGTVISAEAVSLNFFLDITEEWQDKAGHFWEKEFLAALDKMVDITPNIEIAKFVSSTPAWEMEVSKNSITPNLLVNVAAMILFCLGASSMSDAVRSKPLIGFLGLFSAFLATLAGFGLMCYIGVDFIALCLAAPFLLLGIGIDDTFVMLSAWRRSSSHTTVPERMGRAFSEAAVSITVTSVTDVLSFLAGVITPFPCVRIFCLYTGTAVAFIYVWHLTFFGGCLALSGYAEKNNRHGLFLFKTTPKSMASNRSWLYRHFMAGGINPVDPHNPKDNRDHAGMVFLRDKLGYALSLKWVKSLVLVLFTVYLVVSVWGITRLQEGLEKRNTVNFDSYSIKYYDTDDKYYSQYRFPINVVVSGDIQYSDKDTQAQIDSLMFAFENSTYIAPGMSSSWLREFLNYVDRNQDYDDIVLDIDTEVEFVRTVKNQYLSDLSSPLHLDVMYSPLGDTIAASRFIVQGHNVVDALTETAMVEQLRQIAKDFSTENFKVTVFHPYFIYIDQYLEILPQTIQSVLVTSGFMMIVSFIMIPNPLCSLWVAFSILSIEAGVLGYMTWWGVNLDGIALINLIMCIGFSVDFSAHICYHYMSEEGKSPEERISASLYALGLPIIQGAVSTILGVFGLAFAPSYVYVTFFKMVFLVIFLGAVHGLILLPVLLSLFGPGSCKSNRSSKSSLSSSPPSTVVSVSKKLEWTLGFVTPDLARRDAPPTHLPIDHFQRMLMGSAGSPNFHDFRQSEFEPDRFTFLTRLSDEGGVVSTPVRLGGVSDPRLTPVPESDEQYDSIIAQLGQRRGSPRGIHKALDSPHLHHARLGSPHLHNARLDSPHLHHTRLESPRLHHARLDSPRLQARLDSPRLDSSGLRTPQEGPSPTRARAPMNMEHKKLCKSKSHKPRSLADKQMLKEVASKQPLRKYHSFPYHMFINDGGYSSDDSITK